MYLLKPRRYVYGGDTGDDLAFVADTFLEQRTGLVGRVLAQRRSEKLTLQEVMLRRLAYCCAWYIWIQH